MPSFWDRIYVDGNEMELYSGVPSGTGPFPAVVVAQAAGGLDEFIQTIVDRLAGQGYAAVAPNLYHRTTIDIEEATGKNRRELLDDIQIMADMNATVDFLRQHSAIDGEKIGLTGFCMGGRVVWLAAATNPHFKAAVPYYGGNIKVPWGQVTESPFDLTSQINCPMMFHFGGIDINPSLLDMASFDEELDRLNKPHQFFTYPGANHRFMDHTFPQYQKEAAELSWTRTLAFFESSLKTKSAN